MVKSASSGRKKFNLYLLPLMFIIGILPFIVRVKEYDPELQGVGFVGQSTEASDIYLYYKHWIFVIIAAIMVCLIILQCFLKQKPIKFKKLFIPLCGYALLVILSSLLSEYSHFSLNGGYEQFQSMWALLGYTLLAYYGFIFISDVKDVKILMTVLTVSTIVMMIIGLSQAFGMDIMRSDFAAKLIIPKYLREQGTLSFIFGEKTVYLTLYNPNYVGSYVSLLSPVFLMLIFTKKNVGSIVLNAVLYVALLLALLGSGSRAGLIGVFASLIMLAFIFGKKMLKYWSEIILVLILIIGTIITMNNYSNNSIFNRLKSAYDIEKTEYNLTSIRTETDSVKLVYKGHTINLQVTEIDEATESISFMLLDENGFQIPTEMQEDGISFLLTDERFSRIKVTIATLPLSTGGQLYGFTFNIDNKNWTFMKVNGAMTYATNTAYFVSMVDGEQAGPFVDYPKLLSHRGYIWSSTIPLIKDNIVLGTGPDTFLLYFPNYDYLARYNNGFENEVITKPHNMYFQIAIETGLLSLICFLVFYFWYFVNSIIRIRRSDKSNYLTLVNIGILSGTFGYMVVGLINDSMIVVAPLFWGFIGIGIGINTMLKNKYEESNSPIISNPAEIKNAKQATAPAAK